MLKACIFVGHNSEQLASVLWCCWLGVREGIRPVKTEWWVAGMVICLERGADLHVTQLMPLLLTVSCFSEIQIGLPFRYRLTRVVPEKGPLNMCILLCVDCDGAGVHGTGRLLQSVAVCWARRSWTTRSVSAREATWWRHKHRAVGLRTAAAEVGRRNRPTFIQPRRRTHLRWAALWVAEIVFSLNTSQCARVFTLFLTNTLPP